MIVLLMAPEEAEFFAGRLGIGEQYRSSPVRPGFVTPSRPALFG